VGTPTPIPLGKGPLRPPDRPSGSGGPMVSSGAAGAPPSTGREYGRERKDNFYFLSRDQRRGNLVIFRKNDKVHSFNGAILNDK
jgi:hypothetical protein